MTLTHQSADEIQKKLGRGAQNKVELKINNNRSTMLSVRWEPDCTKVSLHRIFLKAPKNIMQDLACYVRQEQENISPFVKAFIEDNLKTLDYSHELNLNKLHTKGHVFDLQTCLNDLNREYFNQQLNLHITWFGKPSSRGRNKLTFGLYHDPLKLIKINRLLDSPSFPSFLIEYVVYHEMVHHVCPSYYENGIHKVHTKEFKERELKFKYYHLAQKWLEEHTEYLFNLD